MAEKQLHCPTCKKLVTATDADFPFCSERCRLIDLGKWASGAYRISSPVHDPELTDYLPDEPDGLRGASRRARHTDTQDTEEHG